MGLTSSTQATGFNPRTPCGVRHAGSPHPLARSVSIHALLAECDPRVFISWKTWTGFNPRTPCGVRPETSGNRFVSAGFQSTHSLRSATSRFRILARTAPVSIHALLAECDIPQKRDKDYQQSFNPRTPCGVRPVKWSPPALSSCFNPRTPCGVRHVNYILPEIGVQFQSTHSLRSATKRASRHLLSCQVSIHALLAECD